MAERPILDWLKLATSKFDPEGVDYDYDIQKAFGIERQLDPETNEMHYQSRLPVDPEDALKLGFKRNEDVGLLLKGAGHETFQKGVKVDEELGYKLVKRHGRYWTVKEMPND